MASEVDISNLALARLGDGATVASLDPPEGSAQAEHCARFYPIARDALLEMHSWGFATRRGLLPQVANASTEWAYAYACPLDAINLLAVRAAGATSDYSAAMPMSNQWMDSVNTGQGLYTPQEYSAETSSDGTQIILTNTQNATLHYTARITDTTKFSPLFVQGLSIFLAANMAGPIIKGDAGRAEARALMSEFNMWFGKAAVSDANQQHHNVKPSVGWMANR